MNGFERKEGEWTEFSNNVIETAKEICGEMKKRGVLKEQHDGGVTRCKQR